MIAGFLRKMEIIAQIKAYSEECCRLLREYEAICAGEYTDLVTGEDDTPVSAEAVKAGLLNNLSRAERVILDLALKL